MKYRSLFIGTGIVVLLAIVPMARNTGALLISPQSSFAFLRSGLSLAISVLLVIVGLYYILIGWKNRAVSKLIRISAALLIVSFLGPLIALFACVVSGGVGGICLPGDIIGIMISQLLLVIGIVLCIIGAFNPPNISSVAAQEQAMSLVGSTSQRGRRIIRGGIFFAVLLLVVWGGYRFYTPTNLEGVKASEVEVAGWKTYKDDNLGFQIKYPPYYALCNQKSSPNFVTLYFIRSGIQECQGKGIRLLVNRNPPYNINSVDDYIDPELTKQRPSWDKFSCHSRLIAGDKAVICSSMVPGEDALFTGGIFKGDLYLVHTWNETDKALMVVNLGDFPTVYRKDHDLQKDFIKIPLTLQWVQAPAPATSTQTSVSASVIRPKSCDLKKLETCPASLAPDALYYKEAVFFDSDYGTSVIKDVAVIDFKNDISDILVSAFIRDVLNLERADLVAYNQLRKQHTILLPANSKLKLRIENIARLITVDSVKMGTVEPIRVPTITEF